MRALGVLVPEPLDRVLDVDGTLLFSQNHFTGVAPDAEFEALAAHRAKLDPHQPLDDYGRFRAALLSFRLGHCAPYRALCVASGRGRAALPCVLMH
jgi:hypothetical protein